MPELVGVKMHLRRPLEQATVGVRDPRVEAVLSGSRLVQRLEEAEEIVRGGAFRARDQVVDDRREPVPRNLAEILGEETPDRLEQEVAENGGVRRCACLEPLVQIDEMDDGLARELSLAACEHGLVAGKEEQGVVLEQLVEKRLRFAALAAVIHTPLGSEDGEPRADLLAGERHAR
ncbi:MAG: hypothetical protein H0V45_04215 [Actinobacteria bacterium]|nr:hypothetical protein [Actinomycetota bacterium]